MTRDARGNERRETVSHDGERHTKDEGRRTLSLYARTSARYLVTVSFHSPFTRVASARWSPTDERRVKRGRGTRQPKERRSERRRLTPSQDAITVNLPSRARRSSRSSPVRHSGSLRSFRRRSVPPAVKEGEKEGVTQEPANERSG